MCLVVLYKLSVLIYPGKLKPYLIHYNTTTLNRPKPYRLNLSRSNRL